MITATEVGGDFYEILPQENNGTYFAIGDVTDHGLESGLVMLMTQAAIRTCIDNINSDLEKALVQINRVLYRNIHDRMGDKRNLTLTLLYHEKNKVRYVGQHESILVHRKETNTIEEIDTLDNGMYVGLLEDGFEDFVAESSFSFNQGDTILLYTDGATEAENPSGDMYGIERLMNTLQQNIEQGSDDIINNLTTNIFEFMNGKELLDDISLMVIKKV
jgi:sigma-B regulation protein RsbU (phosphoserine phosphatase)